MEHYNFHMREGVNPKKNNSSTAKKKGGGWVSCSANSVESSPTFGHINRATERGGATYPGPQTSRGHQLEKYPKIEQGLIKIGASTRH